MFASTSLLLGAMPLSTVLNTIEPRLALFKFAIGKGCSVSHPVAGWGGSDGGNETAVMFTWVVDRTRQGFMNVCGACPP
jgi:hypothetical protein